MRCRWVAAILATVGTFVLFGQVTGGSSGASVPGVPSVVADAGRDQTAQVGSTVVLNGSGSSSPSGSRILSYEWTFTSRPAGSAATIRDPTSPLASFTLDVAGTYVAKLNIDNGSNSSSASVVVSSISSSPVANAGLDQTVAAGSKVKLNGSRSSTVDERRLNYSWSLVRQPNGSTATLAGASSVVSSFIADQPGTYLARLVVNDGSNDSKPAVVTITTLNTRPVANAGAWRIASVGASIQLNGSGSSDVDGDPITYRWSLVSVPAGSTATLSRANAIDPTFNVDAQGIYVAQLIVNDGHADSAPSTVIVSTQNAPPVANAGSPQFVATDALVQLNGAGSTDVDGDSLRFHWSLVSVPPFSAAVLSDPTAINPTFTADVPGTYVAQLIVNDGELDSPPSTVMVSTNDLLAPRADAGPDQAITSGTTVTLHGAGLDPQGLQLSYRWALISRPQGSAASLSDPTTVNPTFGADLPGTYVAQLIVNNGHIDSTPSTVTVTTGNTVPVANAGGNQNVLVGATVSLDGASSSDADQDALTYSWSLTSRPANSSATFSVADGSAATFVADIAGTYLAQLVVKDVMTSSRPVTVLITATNSSTITLTPNPLNVASNGTRFLTILLPAPAGADGRTVNLATSDASVATLAPSVAIPQGATAANTVVTAGANVGSAAITASADGLSSGISKLNVIAPSIGIKLDAASVGLERTVNGLIILNTPAPQGGLALVLLSKPATVIEVTAPSLIIPTGSSTATFTVKGLAVGSATIAVSASGYTDSSITVNVAVLAAIQLPSNTTVAPGESAVFPIALTTPAPAGGVTVSLASADATIVNVAPASVFIAEGSTEPGTQPRITGVNFGSAAMIATAPGYPAVSEAVQVAIAALFSLQNLTIIGPSSQIVELYLSSPAPPAGLIIILNSSNPAVATVPATVAFPAGATSATVAVTAVGTGATTVHASALPNVADTSAVVNVVTAGPIGVPSTLTVALGQSTPLLISLPVPAPSSGLVVGLSSSDASKAALSTSSVVIPSGQKSPATPPQINGINFGTASINVSAPGYTAASVTVQVADTIAFFPATLSITGIGTQNLTLNLSAPAPSGGLTIDLRSSNTSVATVPAIVAFPANATSATVPVTSVSLGAVTIHASSLPNIADTTASVTVVSPGNIVLPINLTVAPGQSVPFPVTLSQPAPSGGVTINLVSSDISKVTVAPGSVQIPEGSIAPSTQPHINGVHIGSATITASASGYAAVNQTVLVGLTISFSPANLTIVGTATQDLTLTLSAPAPAGGLVVSVSSSDSAVATVPATVTFVAGGLTATVPVTGVASGVATIHASALPSVADTTASVTVNPVAASGSIVIGNVAVGQNLEAPVVIVLPQPAPSGGTQLTLTSSDSSKLLISASPGVQGTGSLVVPVPGGAISVGGVFAQALAAGGVASLTVSAPGLSGGTGTVTMTPSGFVIQGPNGMSAGFSVTQGTAATLTIVAARLDPSMSFAEAQQLRGGFSASVSVTTSSTDVGTISASPLILNGGDQGATTQFKGVNTGSTTITAVAPTGFSIPAQGANTAVATVIPAGLVAVKTTVGKNLESTANILLNGPAPGSGLQISITSNDPSRMLLSTSPTAVGSASIVLSLSAGSNRSPDFYVYGLGNSGTVAYSASAAGFGTATGTVTLAPSGFFVSGPFGPDSRSFFTTTGAPPTAIDVMSAVLDASMNIVAVQPIAGGNSVIVNVASSNQSVGTIPTSPVTIAGGNSSAEAKFQPATPGTTTLSASVPTGFSAPQNGTVAATVLVPGIGITGAISIGSGLQETGTLLLSQVAPTGGLNVILTSNNPSELLLSTAATGKGSSSITLKVPAGSYSASYFIQSFGSTGSASYSASAPGYGTRTATITLAPSGAVVYGPFGLPGYSTTVSAGPSPFTVSMAQLNTDNSFAFVEQLAGGTSVTVSLSTSNPAVGSIASPIVIPGGSGSANTNFTPLGAGKTTISVVTPPGFTASTTNASVPVIVQ